MSLLIALQTLQNLSSATHTLQTQDNTDSSLALFHSHLSKTLSNLFNNDALLSVKFLGMKSNNIPDDTTLRNLILKEIGEVHKKIDLYSAMDNVQAAKNKLALVKIFDILTKIIS